MNKAILLSVLSTGIFLHNPGYAGGGFKEPELNNWFIQLQGAALFPLSNKALLIDNGSNAAAPENTDAYSVKNESHGSIALTVGNRIPVQSSWINHYTLSSRLQYVLPVHPGDTIMQYNRPEFLNYSYNWKLSSLAWTLDSKVNLLHSSQFSPYVNGGLGLAFNRARSYYETAFAGITARYSPAYENNNLTQFTYHLGFGLDYFLTPNWILSAGYEFESLGSFATGRGQSTWSSEALRLKSYQANTVLIGITSLL